MGYPNAINWGDVEIARLREHHANGLSSGRIAAEINKEFGLSLSRSAICGKINRLGLVSPKKPSVTQAAARERRRQTSKFNRKSERAMPAATEPVRVRDDPLPLDPRFACMLIELENENCRWPYGDPDAVAFRFCGRIGADMKNGAPYCDHHAQMGANDSQPRHLSDDERAQRSASARRMIARRGPTYPSSKQQGEP